MRLRSILVALLASGCGTVTLPGIQIGASSRSSPPPGGGAQASRAGGTSAASVDGKPLSLQAGPSLANPSRTDVFEATTGISASKAGFPKCDAYLTPSPVAKLTVPPGQKKLQVTAHQADALVIKTGDSFVCQVARVSGESPVVLLDEWPAGVTDIYIGHRSNNWKTPFSLEVEDLSRPRDLPWVKDAKAQRVTFKKPLAEPVLLVGGPGGKPRTTELCQRYTWFPETPSAVIEVADQPLTGLKVSVRATDKVTVALVGPVTPDGRNLRAACAEGTDHVYPRLEPGTYGVFIGSNEKTTPSVANVLLSSEKGTRDPLLHAPIASGLSVHERDLFFHFPQLTLKDLFDSDAFRSRLFSSAPAELFVFPRHDLNDGTAGFVAAGESKSGETLWPGKDVPALAFPAKDEPLLKLGEYVLTADGLLFTVKADDLSAKPSGAAVLPAKPRNPQLSWDASLQLVGKEDDAALKTFDKTRKPYDACVNKVWAGPNAKIAALAQQYPSAVRDQQIQAIRNKAYNDQAARCSLKKLDEARDKAWAALIKSRTARRDANLASVKKHVPALLAADRP